MTTHICNFTQPDDDPDTARDLLERYGLPEEVIDGVLCLHAQELAAVQREAIRKTDDPVFYEGEAGWLVNLIEPEDAPAVPAGQAPATGQADVEPSDPTECSGDEGFCPEHGFHRHSLKQPGEPEPVAPRSQIRTVDNECCGDEPPQGGTWGDCWCTLPPGHDGEHQCQPCTDRHGAPGWTDEQPAAGAQQPKENRP